MSNENHPFNWLPRPHEYKDIPGGVLWCDSWEVEQTRGESCSGTIIFKFVAKISEIEKQDVKQIQNEP